MLRSGTRLEGPKGISVGVESKKEKDKGLTPLPRESELEKKIEGQKEKEIKSLPSKPYMPPLPFCNGPNPHRVRIVTIKNISKQTDRVSTKIGQILGIEPYKLNL